MTAKRWSLTVTDSFSITGRGLIVVGDFDGHAWNGEPAQIVTPTETFRVDQVWFEAVCRSGRDNPAIRLGRLDKERVPAGSVVQAVDTTQEVLREAVESFGAITGIAVDDTDPILLGAAYLEFEKGGLTINALADDDSIAVSAFPPRPQRWHDISTVQPWADLVGGRPLWIWTMTNQQGYTDGVQFQVRRPDREVGLQLVVYASSLKPFRVAVTM